MACYTKHVKPATYNKKTKVFDVPYRADALNETVQWSLITGLCAQGWVASEIPSTGEVVFLKHIAVYGERHMVYQLVSCKKGSALYSFQPQHCKVANKRNQFSIEIDDFDVKSVLIDGELVYLEENGRSQEEFLDLLSEYGWITADDYKHFTTKSNTMRQFLASQMLKIEI